MRGIAIAPVIGDGGEFPVDRDGLPIVTADRGPFRPSVADRDGSPGDRMEFVIDADKAPWALALYDVADPSDFAGREGEALLGWDDLNGAAPSRLGELAEEAEVSRDGAAREVMRRIGQTISPSFDERKHFRERKAPPTGSFVVDTFTDEDLEDLTEHTGEEGAEWLDPSENSRPSNFSLAGNKVYTSSTNLLSPIKASGKPASPDYDIQCDVTRMAELTRYGGPAGRMPDVPNDGDYIYYDGVSERGTYQLRKIVEAAVTLLASFEGTHGEGETRTLLLSLRDSGHTLFVDGEEVCSSSDNTIEDVGFPGLSARAGGIEAGMHLDNFTATDAGGGEAIEQALTALTDSSALQTASAVKQRTLTALTDSSALQTASAVKQRALTALTDSSALQTASAVKQRTLIALTDSSALQTASAAKQRALTALTDSSALQTASAVKQRALTALTDSSALKALKRLIEVLRIASFGDESSASITQGTNAASISQGTNAATITEADVTAIIEQDEAGAVHP